MNNLRLNCQNITSDEEKGTQRLSSEQTLTERMETVAMGALRRHENRYQWHRWHYWDVRDNSEWR